MDGDIFIPASSGDGVQFGYEKLKPGVARRIEMLGKMNDRRVAMKGLGDWKGLLQLAEEYEAKKMPKMAAEIRKEAYEFKG